MTIEKMRLEVRFYEVQLAEIESLRGRGFDARVEEARAMLERARAELLSLTDPRSPCLCGVARVGDRVELGDGESVYHEAHSCRRMRRAS